MNSKVISGGMSKDEAKAFLRDTAMKAWRKQAGYIVPSTDESIPEDGDVARLLYDMREINTDCHHKHAQRLENRLAMFLYGKTYEMLTLEENLIVDKVYDFTWLCPFCEGTRKRRRCNCKNTGLIARRTIKLMAKYIEQVDPPRSWANYIRPHDSGNIEIDSVANAYTV